MANDIALKREIERTLKRFGAQSLETSALKLFDAMGYRSERRLQGLDGTVTGFMEMLDGQGKLNTATALLDEWTEIRFLFQITQEELVASKQLRLDFGRRVENRLIEAYMVVAIGLRGEEYSRSKLASITREINKVFTAPAMVLFSYGSELTLAVIDRRLNKRDESRDVLEKVTLIKDINTTHPHRAHVEILHDLALKNLAVEPGFTNFVELHDAWRQVLDVSELNKRFYRRLAAWYFWAQTQVQFPKDAGKTDAERNATGLIRLLTRLIFVWFTKQKGLITDDLFDKERLDHVLNYSDRNDSTYYKAILQNLFFATLNTEMKRDKPEVRRFRGKNKSGGRDSHYGVSTVYRYEDYFLDRSAALQLFEDIPFLNGGLFECLDDKEHDIRIDGFSEHPSNVLRVPDLLFFSPERDVDLSDIYGDDRRSREKVVGLIDLLHQYKFTIDENTPIEEEVALDPELLGKVFENLLATYNPETGATARKQTGSFYTPREIVNYMVDESLVAYFEAALLQSDGGRVSFSIEVPPAQTDLWGDTKAVQSQLVPRATAISDSERRELIRLLRTLLAYGTEEANLTERQKKVLLRAIDGLRALYPACGSGAFPIGMLQKLVFVLARLDPGNKDWQELQRQKALHEIEEAYRIGEKIDRVQRLQEIEENFERNADDYGRKLYLIENCLYGVDIQPIAVQIAKLRCFISLIVDQRVDNGRPNRGVTPLPNLETKFVAANSLISIDKPTGGKAIKLSFGDATVADLRDRLADVRHRIFNAKTPDTKRKLREQDAHLRKQMGEQLAQSGWDNRVARQLAEWDPYAHNTSADFFDPEWMFGVTQGFDVIIGNPPYMRVQGLQLTQAAFMDYYRVHFVAAHGSFDIYALFIERGYSLLAEDGLLAYIVPHKFFQASFGQTLRRLLTARQALREVVRFGAEQVFDEATTYTCLLFLSFQPNSVRFFG